MVQHCAVLIKTLINFIFAYFFYHLNFKIVRFSAICRLREAAACRSLQYLILSHKVAFDLCTSAHSLIQCPVCLHAARSLILVQCDYEHKEV